MEITSLRWGETNDMLIVNDKHHVPYPVHGWKKHMVADFLSSGGTIDPHLAPEGELKVLREQRRREIKAEGLKRISAAVPAINNLVMIDLLRELWPMLNTNAAGADMVLAMNLAVFAKDRLGMVKSATKTQLDTYDAATDNWPT